MKIPFSRQLLLAINILLVFTSAFAINVFLSYKDYTLWENGKWQSVKTTLKGVNGVYANMFTKQALHKNHLNISSWCGYQELIYKEPVKFHTLQFIYQSGNTPFSVILNKTDSLFAGILFNYKQDGCCCLFIADSSHRFVFKQVFYINPSAKKWNWNNVSIVRVEDSLKLNVNDQEYLNTSFPLPDSIHFGFKGDQEYVFIDDVSVYDETGKLQFAENFNAPFKVYWGVTFFFIIIGLIVCFFLSRGYSGITLAFNVTILIGIVACFLVYYFYLSGRYVANADNIDWHGFKLSFDDSQTVCNNVTKEFKLANNKPVILFVGTSQTWGAGTSNRANAYPELVEKRLREYFKDSSIVVINSGICGLTSDKLYNYYSNEWYKYHPLITVIDLSTNDHDTTIFKKSIKAFLELNQLNGIKTLIIPEPNNVASAELKANHILIEREANKYHVPVVRMQSYLDSCSDKGFLWWDFVHLTDFGYSLLANKLSVELERQLQLDSTLLRFDYSIQRDPK